MFVISKAMLASLLSIAVVVEGTTPPGSEEDPFPFLADMRGELVIDGTTVTAGAFGIRILDLNAAGVSEDLLQDARKFKSQESFCEAICEKLIDPESCLAAYVTLNQLYPEHALKLATGSFGCAVPDEGTSVPIKILSGGELLELYVSMRSFGDICRVYWRKKLGVRSEIEKTLDETDPDWRKRLGLPDSRWAVPRPVAPCSAVKSDCRGCKSAGLCCVCCIRSQALPSAGSPSATNPADGRKMQGKKWSKAARRLLGQRSIFHHAFFCQTPSEIRNTDRTPISPGKGDTRTAVTPAGVSCSYSIGSGGIAALNHRLPAENPAGLHCN